MPNYNVIPLQFKPGIQRDGTPYNAKACIDGQWVRWTLQEGALGAVPNKIGGYKTIDKGDGTIIRTLYDVAESNAVDTYMGRADSLKYQHFDFDGNGTGEVDRTPPTQPPALPPFGWIPNPDNLWDFDLFANSASPQDPLIVAHVAPNASDVSNTIRGPIFYGDTVGPGQNLPLTQIIDDLGNPVLASGGILYSSPLMIAYGNNGFMQWSKPGIITPWDHTYTQFIANTKIIYMTNYRGILAWTLNSLINLVYIPTITGPDAFSTTTIDSSITVMSPRSIVSYRQQFFWVGNDQFYFFNGVVQRLKNTMQTDWFFKNVNRTATAKVWGMVIPGQREIWWFYPRGSATECTNVIIYNEELNCWYDSEIGRAAGLSPTVFPFPVMSDNQPLRTVTRTGIINTFPLWLHEFGYDKVIDDNKSAVNSFFETPIIDLFEGDPKNNRLIRSRRIEPDFLQNGNMTVTINNRMFASDTIANGNVIQSGPYTFDDNTQKVDDINSQGRLVSFIFQSDEIGGAYEMGKTLLSFNIGDVQP